MRNLVMKPSSYKLKNGRTLSIREAEANDARGVLDYLDIIAGETEFLSFEPGEFEPSEAEEGEFLDKCRESENRLFLLAMMDEVIAGTLSFTGGDRVRLRHCGELGLSVRKECWGLGIGALMLERLICWARESGVVKKVNLRVRTDNQRAIRLYERMGFLHEGRIRKAFYVNGRYFDEYWMGLEL